MDTRSSGVLMHISSLPGAYGIGSFGKEAVAFAKRLKEMGFSYWQTLPFTTTDACNSPYKSFSAFAGNPYFIDLETLATEGLLTESELKESRFPEPYAVDFSWLTKTRIPLLKTAFGRIGEKKKLEIQKFCDENPWLPDYALYMTLKDAHDGDDWYLWEPLLKLRDPEALEKAKTDYADEILFYCFLQTSFYSQWAAVKKEINEIGVQIIGDMPIYLSLESSDVWANRVLFELDEDGEPKRVAGCPPDYFSADGQLWGNPLYDWAKMKAEGYTWWLDRIEAALALYDMVRIDHFRAFSAYWAVPAEAKTAKEGKWVNGPGMDFFKTVFAHFNDPQIIAEDLGVLDDGVIQLLKDTGLPGMRVMQFAFISDDDNLHLPHNYTRNHIAYTGTHDNNTILGWLWEATPEQRKFALDYCNFHGTDWSRGGVDSESCRMLIRTLWQSCAKLTLVPIQDLCGFGSDTKMNKPGVAEGNWAFRITENALDQIDKAWMLQANRIYRRSSR